MQIKENPLFTGISSPVFLESHYDEVCNFNDYFTIIATNEDCAVQAFQYKNLPVWGVQFHPEMQFENGNEMVKNHLLEFPNDNKYYKDELENEIQIKQNFLIFKITWCISLPRNGFKTDWVDGFVNNIKFI
jgi:GMP synthase (glutamine-hydrolysing)